ncbi:WASH complex subunit 1 [Toxorhynchites rutilus septentrionalis]|uniref:WASH complex subunit 1 n=1 Tax=Toxorhynchites rutilus septentrionalis TaxID=329112 RepID=UPI00247B17F6|nr:WASH complex subunit 1 [Toxorhynchites rutilus septentrionalis]
MHCYSIPTIDPDLRHEETILQAINIFEFLNEVIDDVFGKVNQRIEKNRKRLTQINARIDKVNSDVAKLKETKEAIIIYSPCRYPGAEMDTTVVATFTSSNGIRMKESEFRLCDKSYVPAHSYQEKLQFYHVKSSNERHRIFPFDSTNTATSKKQNIQFLDSILMFNSKDFAFDYKGSSAGSRTSKRNAKEIREEKILSASSPIIRNRSKRKGQEIFYTPTLNDAPKIDVPVDLPDLPGIVTNIQYAGNHTLIAPSLQLAAIADQLPELEDLAAIGAKEASAGKTLPETQSCETTQRPATVDIADAGAGAMVHSTPPPPPPPPPLPPVEKLTVDRKTDENDGKPKKGQDKESFLVEPVSDAHFNLMEAIRQAGGVQKAKLRQSAATDTKKDSTEPSKPGEQKSFIDDLHNKLQMRRKGISGARDNQEPGNVIDRISAMIPPPPPKIDASTSESNDEDWE